VDYVRAYTRYVTGGAGGHMALWGGPSRPTLARYEI
jgi:hypothetical protein